MIFYNVISFVLRGVAYASIAFVPWKEGAVVLFCLCSITSSANCGSFYKCATFVARQYADFVISAIQFAKCIALFSAPGLVAIFVYDDADRAGWNVIFISLGVALIVVNVLFMLVATEEAAPFTTEEPMMMQKPSFTKRVSMTLQRLPLYSSVLRKQQYEL